MGSWTWLSFYPTAVSHAVPTELAHRTIEDLLDRGCPVDGSRDLTGSLTIDQPGMIWRDRQMMVARVDGLALDVPCHDWGHFLLDLRKLAARAFKDGTPYYKLHGYLRCVVMTPAQRDELLAALEAGYDEAHAKAEADLEKIAAAKRKLADSGHFMVAVPVRSDPKAAKGN